MRCNLDATAINLSVLVIGCRIASADPTTAVRSVAAFTWLAIRSSEPGAIRLALSNRTQESGPAVSPFIVEISERQQDVAQILDRIEVLDPQRVLLEGADEALGAAIPLRGAHEGGRARDAQERELRLEGVRHVLASVIVPDAQAGGDLGREAAEGLPHPLADRLQRLEARDPARRMDAHALCRAVIDGHEHRDLPLSRPGGGQVGAAHRVDPVRDDGAIVVARSARCADPRGGQWVVGAHQAQHPALGSAHALHAQPCPDLAMAFAVEGAVGQDSVDLREQCGIWHRPDRAGPPRGIGCGLRSEPRAIP